MKLKQAELRREQPPRLRLIDGGPVEAPRKGLDGEELTYVELIERLVAEELPVQKKEEMHSFPASNSTPEPFPV